MSTAANSDFSPTEPPTSIPTPTMNEFQWLLVLGFPPDIAASSVMPGVFIAGDKTPTQDPRPAR